MGPDRQNSFRIWNHNVEFIKVRVKKNPSSKMLVELSSVRSTYDFVYVAVCVLYNASRQWRRLVGKQARLPDHTSR